MNEFPICQSCGMPLETPEQMGILMEEIVYENGNS